MKFTIEIIGEGGKSIAKMSGFPTLEDACGAAGIIAKRRRGTKPFVSVRMPKGKFCYDSKILTGICCESINDFPPGYILADAKRELDRQKMLSKQAKARHDFLLEQRGGFDGPVGKMLFSIPTQPDTTDAALRKCYFENDFPGVLKRMAELGIHAQGETVTA